MTRNSYCLPGLTPRRVWNVTGGVVGLTALALTGL